MNYYRKGNYILEGSEKERNGRIVCQPNLEEDFILLLNLLNNENVENEQRGNKVVEES